MHLRLGLWVFNWCAFYAERVRHVCVWMLVQT